MRVLPAILLLSVIAALVVWLFAPREEARLLPVRIDDLPEDLDAWLTTREAGIAPDLAARIDWAGQAGQQTDLAIVYLHGFSASPAELRPVPEQLATAFGANLYVARLTGHGLGGQAMAQASVADWWRDTSEAVAIGQRLGKRLIVIGTSTGATLAAEAARDPVLGQGIDAVAMISPNFGLQNPAAGLLRWPLARWWVPLIAGRTRCFEPLNAEHQAAWTTCYPTVATLPMAALVGHSVKGHYAQARQPALFIWAETDTVIDPAAARTVSGGWGGPVSVETVQPGPDDDPSHHVIAGEILSPGLTPDVIRIIGDWISQTVR